MFQSLFLFIVAVEHVGLGKASPIELCASFTENGWVSSDPSKRICFSLYNEPSTWWDAEKMCRQEGMFLATPSSEVIDKFLWRNFQTKSEGTFWIGAINKENRGWEWSNGERWDYNQLDSVSKILDSVFGFFKKTSSCAILGYHLWERADCNSQNPFLCQSETTASLTLATCKNTPPGQVGCPASSTQICVPEDHRTIKPSGRLCFIYYEEKLTWWDANKTCGGHGMSLVAVNSTHIFNFMSKEIRWKSTTDFWIGGIKNGNIGWKWTNGEDMTFQEFDKVAVNWEMIFKDTLCALFGRYAWEKKGCDHLAPFVCQLNRDISVVQPERTDLYENVTEIPDRDISVVQPGSTNLHENVTEIPGVKNRLEVSPSTVRRIFRAKKIVGGRLNPRLTVTGVRTKRVSLITNCVRHCSADKNCVLVNFCQKMGYCMLYNDFGTPLSGGATSEIGCSVYMDMAKYGTE